MIKISSKTYFVCILFLSFKGYFNLKFNFRPKYKQCNNVKDLLGVKFRRKLNSGH